MNETTSSLQRPITYPFYKGTISHIFPVARDNSIGIVYEGECLAIAKINKDELETDTFPNDDNFSAYGADGFWSINADSLFVKDKRFVQILDWKKKKVLGMFTDRSKPIDIYLEQSKLIDSKDGIALSLLNYYKLNESGDVGHYSFAIDDIFNKKRLKEVAIPDSGMEIPAFFTPSSVIYRNSYKGPWIVLDNNLKETTHPLVDLLTPNEKDSVFFAFNGGTFISEENKYALIISHNLQLKKDMLYLATWYKKPSIQPIIVDSTVFGSRRLVTSTDNNTMSPSGHWVYFCAESDNNIDNDLHFLIYLDPKLPNGYLPPMKLNIEGTIGCVGWVTNPEGFMLYKNNQLFYYDLSKVKIPED